MNKLILNNEFSALWQDRDPFHELATLDGQIFRQGPGRKTFLFRLNRKSYFAKVHTGVGWGEIFKNLIRLRLPVVSAANEWRAVNRLHEIGVATMTAVAYGEKGWNPAARHSFIVTEALLDTVSLEDYCLQWQQTPPAPHFKWRLIDKLARISRTLHDHGIVHRDYYLCHFLMQLDNGEPAADLRLSLIDLHRALIKTNLRRRWIVKDLAGLYYSAMHIGLTRRDVLRFVRSYAQQDLRQALTGHRSLWAAVNQRARAMFTKHGPNR